jgi:NAD(P)-dependent dehydrogenase (short-subunit alcohol dehydrogenase family)
MTGRNVVVIGGSTGIGLELCRRVVAEGDTAVLTSRDPERAEKAAAELGGAAKPAALDLSRPETIAPGLAAIERVDGLVLSAIERDANSVRDYSIERALHLVTLKLVGYTEVVHALLDRIPATPDSAVVLMGGRAKDRPYPGSTTVSTVNCGVDGLTRALALEIAPVRVNAVHPGIVGDSPFWSAKPASVLDAYKARTPSGRLAVMADVVDAVWFLLHNRSVDGTSLVVDCGWEVT